MVKHSKELTMKIFILNNNKMLMFLVMFISLALSGCIVPQQPEHTKAEAQLFLKLSEEYACKVEREIDPKLISKFNHSDTGSYLVRLFDLPCSFIENDSLYSYGLIISRKIFTEVLDSNSAYKVIIVVFDCKYGTETYYSKNFKYSTNLLD